MGQVKGCHLVGSIPFANTEEVFRKCCAGMENRLRRIPDGETGDRNYFIQYQKFFFLPAPEMFPEFQMNGEIVSHYQPQDAVKAAIEKIKASPRETRYDEYAIASYQQFKKLRDEGVLPKGTKFQVSMPTHINAMLGFVQRAFQPDIEPIYKDALFRAMRNIQDAIPHEDLAFQIDIASEYIFLENVPWVKPWFFTGENEGDKRKEYIYDYILEQIAQVDADVEVGMHHCYGDMQHKHFKEPESLALVAEVSLAIFERTSHPIKFFQCPVPPSAMDKLDSYYEPLNKLLPKLKEHGTELYLGVVREDDLEGTKARVEAAKKAFPDTEFGVATECGLGRVSAEQAESVLKISSEVSDPVL